MLDVSRRELKYLVSCSQRGILSGKLAQIMQKDTHSSHNGYMVRSLYFDSIYDNDFEEKIDGYDNRKKIRLRIYDFDSPTAKLELKEKSGIAQRKRSLSVSRQDAEAMTGGEYSCLLQYEEPVAAELYTIMTTKCYRPKCIVEYDRLAFCERVNDIRITFDSNLRATEVTGVSLFDRKLLLYPVASHGEVTMEVKYNGFLYTYIKNMLGLTEKMQISNSKYVRARMVSKKGRR